MSGVERSDEWLMARIADGDRAAFSALVDRHLDRTVAVAERLLGTRGDAEDVAQEVFLRVWTRASEWQPGRAALATWLYRVTMNLAIDLQRRARRRATEELSEDHPSDAADDAFAQLDRKESEAELAAALAGLPERQRAAVALCYSGGMSNQQAADVLQISVGALEGLLVRARRTLRQRLLASSP